MIDAEAAAGARSPKKGAPAEGGVCGNGGGSLAVLDGLGGPMGKNVAPTPGNDGVEL
jgi:hypothetical protein